MKNYLTPKTVLQAAMLLLICATAINAIAAADNPKDKQTRRMQLLLNAAQQEKSELSSQVETLKKQVGELEVKRTALEKKLGGQSRQLSELSDKQQQAELASKQQQSELADKYQESEKKLKQLELEFVATNKSLQQTQLEKLQEKKQLNGDIQICEKKNSELYLISVKLMDKYQAKGVMAAMLQAEPFTQLEKVRVENLLQEYRDKSDANKISSGTNLAQDAQRP
jgi:septal ring factor EnvC (AmiA/AmiB activator)